MSLAERARFEDIYRQKAAMGDYGGVFVSPAAMGYGYHVGGAKGVPSRCPKGKKKVCVTATKPKSAPKKVAKSAPKKKGSGLLFEDDTGDFGGISVGGVAIGGARGVPKRCPVGKKKSCVKKGSGFEEMLLEGDGYVPVGAKRVYKPGKPKQNKTGYYQYDTTPFRYADVKKPTKAQTAQHKKAVGHYENSGLILWRSFIEIQAAQKGISLKEAMMVYGKNGNKHNQWLAFKNKNSKKK